MMIIIDPAIRILPDDHQIFILHPGKAKRFYNDFQHTNSVFLDLPGIVFDTEPKADNPKLRSLIRMGRRIAAWRNSGSKKDDKPSRNVTDYTVKNPSDNPPKLVHTVIDLYSKAKSGDLIIVPGEGYKSTVYIGEFNGEFDPWFRVGSIRYATERIPARKVTWLPIALAKSQFSGRLVRLMQNRQAIIHVNLEADRREIYSTAYGDYVWKESSGNLIRVTKNKIDLNDLSKSVDLVNYFASQYLALKRGELERFFGLNFNEAIDKYYDNSYFGGVNVEIHSPGYFGRQMKEAAMAGYVSAMLALSGSGVTAQEAVNVKVVNSANIVPSVCDKDLEADIRQVMEMYANLHLWKEDVCPKREATKNSVGLKTGVTIKKDGKLLGN